MSVYIKERPEYLEACLKSLSEQTLMADEVVLVEDGVITSDLSLVIEKYRSQLNIVSVCLANNVGLAAALNEGLKICTYELVARMDTDDLAVPFRFEKLVEYFREYPDLDILGSYAQDLSDDNVLGMIREMPLAHKSIYKNLFCCPFIHPSVMYKKSFIDSIGGYDEKLARRQDYDLWFRCGLQNARFSNLPLVLLQYRFTEGTHSRQSRIMLLRQGLIGFNGVWQLKQPIWKGLGAFLPFIRSFLPGRLEHKLYIVLKRLDPRRRVK
ncbi:glycosyltransferase [Amphritea balenae]|nr:glycosyltransferase [Amphritea balenae]